jgi:uncharacterized protein
VRGIHNFGFPIIAPIIFMVGGCDDANQQVLINQPAMALTGRVVDEADLLDAATEAALEKKLRLLEEEAGPQFVIATTRSLNEEEIVDYSMKLARSWAVGHEDRDDGVILLVAPNERKVRIAVGYGLEGSLNDPFCAKVIREDMLPAFRRNEMASGIIAGADRLIAKMRLVPTLETNDNDPPSAKEAQKAS